MIGLLCALCPLTAAAASESPEPGLDDWKQRFEAAYTAGDLDDATVALTRLAQKWSGQLSAYKPSAIIALASREPSGDGQREARFELRMALYHAYWRSEYRVAPGWLWASLGKEVAERGRESEALEILSHADSPRGLISLRVDKRFDSLVRKAPDDFNIEAAADRQVRDYEEAVSRYPRSIDAVVQLCYAYEAAGRYEDINSLTSVVLGYSMDPEQLAKHFDEDETALNWILDLHASSLAALQHWEEAAQALRIAADGLEHGRRNVSNVINLAQMYADSGRGDAALKTLQELPEDDPAIGRYGRMAWHLAHLSAAVVQGDEHLAGQSLEYMQAHQQEAIRLYQWALVRRGNLDDAAKLLIARLGDPKRYNQALVDVQEYKEPPGGPVEMAFRARWRELIDRADVRHAIARVGHVEHFGVPRQTE